jgi:hypothetical protein
MKLKPCTWLAVALALAPVLTAALAVGGAAYTKRAETALLAEPQMLATPVARIAYAKKLKVEAVKGPWVRVSEGKSAGWVFSGNLAEEAPSETRGLDGLPLAASETSAAAAARPLVPAAEEYAARHGLAQPAEDLKWLAEQKAATKPEDVQAFLKEQRKGEYQ